MKRFTMLLVAVLAIVGFTGCSISQPKPKIEAVKINIPISDRVYYIDNSLDIQKQKRVVKAFVKAFNEMKDYKVIKTPGFLGKTDWNLIQYKEVNLNNSGLFKCLTNFNVAKYGIYHYINTFNYKFDIDTDLKDKNIFFNSPKFYPKSKYIAKITDNGLAVEISGFKTGKEAVDVWLQVKRDLSGSLTKANGDKLKNGISRYLSQTDTGDDFTDLYIYHTFNFDGKALEDKNVLILKPIILQASLKRMIIRKLKHLHRKITDDPKKANVIIGVQNLAFEEKESFQQKGEKRLNSIIKERKLPIYDKYETQMQMITNMHDFHRMGYGNVSKAFAILGLASLFDTSNWNIMSLNLVTIYANGKFVGSKIIGTKDFLRHRQVITPCKIDSLSWFIARELDL